MENKKIKKGSKNKSNYHSIRVCNDAYKKLLDFKNLVNKSKKSKGAIKFEPIVKLAIDLLNEDHVKLLQNKSLKSSDRQEIFKHKYFEVYNTNSNEDFIGFTQTPAYMDFIKEHENMVSRQ